jgi:hypothetical protein
VLRSALLLLLLSALPKDGDDPALLPAPRLTLRLDAPDSAGPWKMVVTNDGDVPLRFAADGRLLSLEIEPPEDAGVDEPYAKPGVKKKAPAPVVCKLPPELRPAGVVEDRAVVLGPGRRYEEVVSPGLYCFSQSESKALVPGARVTAKLGFPDANKAASKAPPRAPFIAEPAVIAPPVSAIKEVVAPRIILGATPEIESAGTESGETSDDPNGPRIELFATGRVDSSDEKTVGAALTIKNTGRRDVRLHVRRDNLLFDVDGPDGSTHCGAPSPRRAVPRELIESLGAGSSRSFEVWIGEMCPNMVFDRPGLYRVRAGVVFPASPAAGAVNAWTRTVITKEPILVRIRQGRLPFFTSPPQIFGGSSGSSG